ncbi:hypothetical protein BpHYR1_035716 [Brachionus plicatilis]|uniref:Uncharacterized protein n=1 Tax=Brachionus plicatilis TaxID=10195 RepID=A0A3M7PZY4_BRAPC|nr:hypothetical protein BpHYR1_035716 [Brachionus plicatilis]
MNLVSCEKNYATHVHQFVLFLLIEVLLFFKYGMCQTLFDRGALNWIDFQAFLKNKNKFSYKTYLGKVNKLFVHKNSKSLFQATAHTKGQVTVLSDITDQYQTFLGTAHGLLYTHKRCIQSPKHQQIQLIYFVNVFKNKNNFRSYFVYCLDYNTIKSKEKPLKLLYRWINFIKNKYNIKFFAINEIAEIR